MRVRVLFFGMLKDLAGRSSDSVELREDAPVGDLLAHYATQIPRLKESMASLAVAVNQQYAGPETTLKSDDEVALLPPVSGGSGKAIITRDAIRTSAVLSRIKPAEAGHA